MDGKLRCEIIKDGLTYLTRFEDSADLAHDWFVAAKVRRALKHKTQVVTKVIPFVLPPDLHREPNYSVLPGSTDDQPATQRTWRDDIF